MGGIQTQQLRPSHDWKIHQCFGYLTNSSLRERFGLKESSSGSASGLIKEAVALDLIKPLDPTTAPRYMKYIPTWA